MKRHASSLPLLVAVAFFATGCNSEDGPTASAAALPETAHVTITFLDPGRISALLFCNHDIL